MISSEDEVRAALEVGKLKNGHGRILAVVCPKNGEIHAECAVFVLRKQMFTSKLFIRRIVPILDTFHAAIQGGENTFSIKYPKERKVKTESYKASSTSDLGNWLHAASHAQLIARNLKYDRNSVSRRASHSWIMERYAKEEQALNVVKWLLTMPDPREVSPSSDSAGSAAEDDEAAENDYGIYSRSDSFLLNKEVADPVVMAFMTTAARNEWVDRQVASRADEYMQKQSLSIRVCSWNVGAMQTPPAGERMKGLQEWLCPGADIISVGLQEIVTLSGSALFVHESSAESKMWEESLSEALAAVEEYEVLVSRQYVGVYHFLAVRKELVDNGTVRGAQCKATGCGILGHGNKGAISTSLVVYDSSLCFVCSHLAAGAAHVARRKMDQQAILKNTVFSGTQKRGVVKEDSGEGSEMKANSSVMLIEDHDIVFWYGDLNYRIDMERDEVLGWIELGKLEELYMRDQLFVQQKLGNAFAGYTELRPEFKPTYKLDVATGQYEQMGEKCRVPAWCDRILFRDSDRSRIDPLTYSRHELVGSDHFPISGAFQIQVDRKLVDQFQAVHADIVKQLDRADNACVPQAEISQREVLLFEDVRYRTTHRKEVTLSNPGQVYTHFRIILPQQVGGWLTVYPTYGLIMPLEKMQIILTCQLHDETAQALAYAKMEVLETLVVLQVDHGNSLFLTVKANTLATAYGRSITSLIKHRQPMRESVRAALHAASEGDVEPLAIPKEAWRLVSALHSRAWGAARLFQESGDQGETETVRECLDTGDPFPPSLSAHAFAEALIQLLRSFPIPVVPPHIRDECLESPSEPLRALSKLPPEHLTLLVYLVAFLRHLLHNLSPAEHRAGSSPLSRRRSREMGSTEQPLSQETLGLIFGGALLSPESFSRDSKGNPRKGWSELRREQAVMLHLLAPPPPAPAPPSSSSTSTSTPPLHPASSSPRLHAPSSAPPLRPSAPHSAPLTSLLPPRHSTASPQTASIAPLPPVSPLTAPTPLPANEPPAARPSSLTL